ncbi:FkbM family methyltransferase [Xanthomonas sp. CFBP 8703]|uniref:FkbM family methyltransferase n=1 Tax=Xanthomonas bonasiae TaxID=2810351 RepID=A0ABS3B3H7_9XANT|nr:FkbM family methyltransferase [Xanthomonas bonasiae]MBN6110288.1 FkbM family methyltransferase [Xanthomonas bonasiae]
MKVGTLLGLRASARAFSFGGRFNAPQSIMRRLFRHHRAMVSIGDFDGDMAMDLSLTEHMQRRIFWMGYYSQGIVALLDRTLAPGMSVIDVGANIGEITLVAAKRVGQAGRVVSFEPVDGLADTLCSHVLRNDLRNVTVVRQGLSNRHDHVPIFSSCGQGEPGDEHHGLGSLFGTPSHDRALQNVEITTLDAYLDANPLPRVDVIKVDIEGAELPCLQGARLTLGKYKPSLIVEVQKESSLKAGYDQRDILDYLHEFGYRFHAIRSDGALWNVDRSSLGPYQNVLCTVAE